MVAEKVKYHVAELWDDVENKREEIINKLLELKETLEKLQLSTVKQKEKVHPQKTI
jgi:hypothetical protein